MPTRRRMLRNGAVLGATSLAPVSLAQLDIKRAGAPDMTETAFLSARELGRLVADKTVSAVELATFFIERIARTHEALNAVVVQREAGVCASVKRMPCFAKRSMLGVWTCTASALPVKSW